MPPSRRLLEEDDVMIGESVPKLRRPEHYAVDWVTDGKTADSALLAAAYELLLPRFGLRRCSGLSRLLTNCVVHSE